MIMMSSQLAADNPGALDTLAERFAAVCASAVDPLEVASALEFDGMSDRAARAAYGVPDVFALARLLYARVPRRPAAPAAEPDPWTASRPLPRGLLYALPAVCFPAAGSLLGGPGILPVLVGGLLSGWGLSQGLAALGYQRLGTSGLEQARQVLRAGLAGCLAVVALVMTATALAAGARPSAAAFGGGEAAYMLGAGVLLVTGAERWLPAAMAPGVTGAVVFLALGKPAQLTDQTWAALAVTPLLACVFAVTGTAGAGRRRGRLPSPAELRGAVPAGALGLLAAGLLSFPLVAGASGHGGGNTGALIAAVPLALSMGAAEWCLLWYQRGTRLLLRQTDDGRWFRRRARRALLTAVVLSTAAATVLTGIALGTAVLSGRVPLDRTVLLPAAGYLLLGAAMFLALLLQAVRYRLVPLAAAAAALGAEIALRGGGVTVQVAVPAALLAVLGGYALARLGDPVLHA